MDINTIQVEGRRISMKKSKLLVTIGVCSGLGLYYKDTLKLLYKTMQAFKPQNLAKSFQSMYEIQPSRVMLPSKNPSKFYYDKKELIDNFYFDGKQIGTRTFMEDTKTSALLICRGNKILFEEYYLGSDESTNFSANSVTKSITSALVGIAVQEGKIKNIDESIANYIDEFKGTELATVSIKDCLQMSSCINFNEERDMGKISFSSMFGKNKMKMIAKLGLYAPSGTDRRYSSINTDILGEIISNATGETLTDYMQKHLWSKMGSEHKAYWTLNNNKELASGGLHMTLRDFARFGLMYLNNGKAQEKQVLSSEWIQASKNTDAPHLQPPGGNRADSKLGYGYGWWIPDGNPNEFVAIGVFGQWIYVNSAQNIVIVKLSADSTFEDNNKEKKHIEFFREIIKEL